MITRQRLFDLFESQGRKCALSGVSIENPADLQGDHIIPVACGGKSVMPNIQLVHSVINRMKGTMSQDEFINWCRLVACKADADGGDSEKRGILKT